MQAPAGLTWPVTNRPVVAPGQRSMYLTSPAGFTLVVTGNASWVQLRELAAALHPVVR